MPLWTRPPTVVTFRQTDPFYTVDLSDPERPTLLGELKIPGFSTYLHDVGDDLILGVGSLDGAPAVSLFDVRSLRSPKLLVRRTLAPKRLFPRRRRSPCVPVWPASASPMCPRAAGRRARANRAHRFRALVATRRRPARTGRRGAPRPTFDEADVLRTAVIGDRLITLRIWACAPRGAPTLRRRLPRLGAELAPTSTVRGAP